MTVAAPHRNITTAVVLAAARNTSYSLHQLISRYTTIDTNSAYTAATTAASVGVNTPPLSPPRMMTGIIMAQKLLASAFMRAPHSIRSPERRSYLAAIFHQAPTRNTPMMRPGTTPERNSLLIEVLVVTP
ncbi:hypothetical protein D3C72_1550580 [compost metagenome]